MANTCLTQSLVITNFNWMNASGNQRCIASPFVISLLSLSYNSVLILPFCISSLRLSRHDPILTKHQAFAPSGPMLLCLKLRFVRAELCCKASARAWQETNDLRNAMKHTAHVPESCNMVSRLRLFFKLANATTYRQETDPWFLNLGM